MIKPQQFNWKTAASLFCLALLSFADNASATLTVTSSNQQGTANTYPFTPTWVVNTNTSLIAGLAPSTALGNFSLELAGRSVNSLSGNTNLTIQIIQPSTSTDTNYVTCGNGNGAGSLIVYTLPASANGFNLTNITVFGGWANRGRDQQGFTVLYSTFANPASFKYLTTVNYNPSVPANTATANQDIINDSLGGVIAANVAAVEFVFTTPTVENNYTGYGAITVGGTPAASVVSPVVSVSTSTQTGASPFTPAFTLESPNLIANLAPSTANGNYTLEGSGGTPILTDGAIGTSGSVGGFATAGGGGGSGSILIYTLTNVVNGSDVTNIVVYSGWGDGGRDGQYFNLSYSTISAPTAYIPITTVFYNPVGTSGAVANRVAISMNNGTPLASGVANLKFDFAGPPSASQFDNAYQGYSEIVVQGRDTAAPPPPPSPYLTQDTLPAYAETVVGDQVVFTAAYSNAPPANLQWQVINFSNTTTNNIAGATSGTLTLNNVQLTDSGRYRLKAVNATNGAAAPSYSTATTLAVSNSPAAVNNVIVNFAGQCGQGAAGNSTNFLPTWTINTNNDLILGFPTDGSGNPGTAAAGQGSFGLFSANGDPTILTDGDFGYINYWPNVGSSPTLVTCGITPAGSTMTYTLVTSSATNGWDLTNIVVYGGWGDGGRNEQKYQVLYSTVAAPTTFNSLVTADYNPNDPNNAQSATRVSLVPATGVLAHNVYAVQFNWNLQGAGPKNGAEGYSEIIVKGTPSAPVPVLTQDVTPLGADDVVGSSLVLMGGFSGATSYQWQKNGTNIPGATTTTLTLNNLQLSDTATNGGYSLVGFNSTGSSVTRGSAVTVNPVPAAVNNAVVAIAHQTSDGASFSPTWSTSTFASSVISGATPDAFGAGNFNDPDVNPISTGLAGGLPVLTDGDYGTIVPGGPHPAFATCGPNAGQFVTYLMPTTTYGYNITNIMIASGWNDGGRDANWATVSYSTLANPTTFIPIAIITNNPNVSGDSFIRATITPASGFLASNVYAIKADFTTPPGIPNGYSGFDQINVFGSPSATNTQPIVVTTSTENSGSPDYVVETNSLIEGQLPSSVGPGAFAGSFNNEPPAGGLPVLTDGTFGPFGQGDLNFATCGGASGAGSSVTYTCPNNGNWTLTNIVVYSGWGNYDRDGQFYNIYYTKASAPNTPLLLISVTYNPPALTGPAANRVNIAPSNGGILATNVQSVTFDFTPQTGGQDNGYSGYAEIVLQGVKLGPPTVNSPRIAGGNLILTGSGGTPNGAYSLLSTTNLSTPVIWKTNATGVLDGNGAFSNAVPVSASQPAAFFRVRMP